MERINDRTVSCYGHIVADGDGALAHDMCTLFDQDAITDVQVCIPAQVRPMYDFNARKIANLSTTSDANPTWIADHQRFEDHGPSTQRTHAQTPVGLGDQHSV